MRGLRLARIAAQAELLRLRYLLRRQAIRATLGACAAVFLLAALAGVHVAGALALAERYTPIQAVLAVAGIDLLIAIVLAGIAARERPGAVEREALQLRRTAVEQAVESVVLATLLSRLRQVRSIREVFDIAAAAVAAWFVGARR